MPHNSGYPASATDFLYHPATATAGYGLKEESPVSLKGSPVDSAYPYGAAAVSAASHHHAAYAAVYQEALVNPYAHHMTAAAASSAMQPAPPSGKRKRKSEWNCDLAWSATKFCSAGIKEPSQVV